jgi:hypothetical protein
MEVAVPDVPEAAGFTAVLCSARGCGPGDSATVSRRLAATLREVVCSSRHGVLVGAGCVVGPSVCALRPTAPVVLVQPCDAERRPVRCAVRVGPLRTLADVEALGVWLRAGDLDPARLPAHLLDVQRRAAAAPAN